MTRRIFITGTDTGVGKTVVTALLLAQLRDSGKTVRAVKPFCTGERADAFLLWELQEREASIESVNPFYFEEPLAPWTAARRAGKAITLEQTVDFLKEAQPKEGVLLIEGAGGLLSPLGHSFDARSLIRELGTEVIVVAANRLGVLNHVLLTMDALKQGEQNSIKLVLVDVGATEPATDSNPGDLRLLLKNVPLFRIPYIRRFEPTATCIRTAAEQFGDVLDEILAESD
jgi:dethiobiotin synthetase